MIKDFPIVIGEGTYGCVHKPSLECLRDKDIQQKNVDYKNKVSKIMPTKNALEEINEYETIAKVDPQNKYYLGKPNFCNVKPSGESMAAVRQCTPQISNLALNNFQDARLLLMNYGGHNLEKFSKSDKLQKHVEHFWIDAHRILLGLKLFTENQIVHQDLKPQNIVYDTKKRFVSFIDFGLMTQKKKIMLLSSNNLNNLGLEHWSFPFDSAFYNKYKFDNIKRLTPIKNYKECIQDLKILSDVLKKVKIQIKDIHDNQELQVYMERLMAEKITYENATSTILSYLKSSHFPSLEKDYIEDIYMFFLSIKSMSYETFLSKSIDNFDIYGTGIAFIYVLKRCYSMLNPEFAKKLYQLLYRMITPDFSKRISIDLLIQEYEILINKYLLEKRNKCFVNGEIQSIITPKPITVPTVPPVILEQVIQTDTQQIVETKTCPEGKVLNQKTGKCTKIKTLKIKTCPEGQIRNPETGRCIKVKPVKNNLVKPCPEGQVRNPKTGRCNKVKIINKTKKICPEGQVRNPKTGRCNKIKPKNKTKKLCPEGKVLQKITRCVKV